MLSLRFLRSKAVLAACAALIIPLLSGATDAQARRHHSHRPRLPEIRLSASNQVPVCVTPERLMAFMRARNHNKKLRRLYKNIAFYYKKHGEALKIRWDYAFFQSMIETNFLTYKTGRGRWGDVDPKQYNFAGIGTTGGGVPGNGFKDVSTGVKAQMQHLIAYSGEYQANPTAPRTKLKQDEIIRLSKKLHRKVRFDDLSGRWAVDRQYAKSIEWVASSYRRKYCRGKMLLAAQRQARLKLAAAKTARANELAAYRARQKVKEEQARRRRLAGLAAQKQQRRYAKSEALARQAITSNRHSGNNRLSALGAANLAAFVPRPIPARRCAVMTASYGGSKTLLIKASGGNQTTYTALSVLVGFEKSMLANYTDSYAPGGIMIGEFASSAAALRKAFALCPEHLARR